MTTFAFRPLRLSMCALALLLALGACGKKGPVRPLLSSQPAAPQNLQILQQGESFLVSWQIPDLNQDGSPAEDIGGFRVYRSEYAVADGCPTCRDPKELVAKIELAYPTGQIIKKRVYWRDSHVTAGSGYRYRVVAVTVGSREGEAATAHRDWREPPRPPQQFQVHAEQGQAQLNWQAPGSLPAGSKLVGYNLYRRAEDRPFPVVPVNAAPLQGLEIIDRSLQQGRSYDYRLSTLIRVADELLESAPTAGVKITLPAAQ